MRETWKPVVGYESHYSISSKGRVRRDLACRGSTAGRILTCKTGSNEYLHVDLSKNNVKRRFRIHRLVAVAFLGKPPSRKHVVNHKDGDRKNNSVENLEWCTARQNCMHALRVLNRNCVGLSGSRNGRAVLTERQVIVIKKLKGVVSQRDIAIVAGVARSLVQRIHQGTAWSHVAVPEKEKPGPRIYESSNTPTRKANDVPGNNPT